MRTLMLVFLLSAPALAGTEVWVDAHFGDDITGHGTEVAPFRTLGKGVASLLGVPGPTTVHVAPGVYDAALGETFPIELAAQMTVVGSGAHQTIVNGGGAGTLLRLADRALVSDLSLNRAHIAVESLGQAFAPGNLRYLRRCVLRNNDVGLHLADMLHSDHGVALVDCVLTKNGTGVLAESTDNDFQSVTVAIYGSTLTGNDVAMQSIGPGAERYLGLFDSIVRGNGDDVLADWLDFHPGLTGNVLGDASLVGADGNVDLPPGFVDGTLGDWHLLASSAVLDLPAPAVPWPPRAMWVSPSAWVWEASFAEIPDMDGDLRAAVVDPGADERVSPSLYARARPALGGTLDLHLQSDPSDALVLFLGLDLLPSPVGLAHLWLAPPIAFIVTLPIDADGDGGLVLGLPPDPLLEGVDVYFQGFRGMPGAWQGTLPVWTRLLP